MTNILDVNNKARGQIWMYKDPIYKNKRNVKSTYSIIGNRPVLIVNKLHVNNHIITVIPLTSKTENRNGVQAYLNNEFPSTILIQEIREVDTRTLTEYLGVLSDEKMEEVDIAIKIYLGFIKDKELEEKYFPYKQQPKSIIGGTDEEEIQLNNVEDDLYQTKESDKVEPIMTLKKRVIRTKDPEFYETVVYENKPAKIRVKVDLDSLSDEDVKFILTAPIKDVCKKFNISHYTVAKYKYLLKEKFNIDSSNLYKVDLDKLSEEDIEFILTAPIKDVCKKFNISHYTVTKYKSILQEKFNIDSGHLYKVDLDSLSDEDVKFILTAPIKDVCKKFNISKATLDIYKSVLQEKFNIRVINYNSAIDLNSLSEEDIEFILTAPIKDVCKKFNISDTTLYKYKDALKAKLGITETNKKQHKVDLNSLSEEDIEFILTAQIEDICKKFNISKATLGNYRKILRSKFNINTKQRRGLKIDLNSLSEEDVEFILTAQIEDICKKFNISKPTVKKYQNILKKKNTDNVKKSESKLDVDSLSYEDIQFIFSSQVVDVAKKFNISCKDVPKYKDILKKRFGNRTFNSQVYMTFKNKKINELSDKDKAIFIKLDDVEKLATYMGLSKEAIINAQAWIRKEISK